MTLDKRVITDKGARVQNTPKARRHLRLGRLLDADAKAPVRNWLTTRGKPVKPAEVTDD